MKVFITPLNDKFIWRSGMGRAVTHQKEALQSQGIDYVKNPREKFDLLHVNTYDLVSLYYICKARLQGKKVIVHAHSTKEDFENSFFFANWISWLFKKWIVFFYNRADLLLTPTVYSKKIIQGYGIQKSIINISNGVNLAKFQLNKNHRSEFRKQHGFSEERKLIVSIGFPIERKGVDDFVELAKRMPEYDFLWCGELEDYLLPSKVRKLIATKLPNLFFPGYVEDIYKVYQAADLFFMPSREETEGIVMLEALASKVPILCRDIGAFSDWLYHGVHVVKAKDVDGFEATMRDVFSWKSDQITQMVDNGYKVAEKRNITSIGKKLKTIYSTLLETGGAVKKIDFKRKIQR